jgi:hypothetical protein
MNLFNFNSFQGCQRVGKIRLRRFRHLFCRQRASGSLISLHPTSIRKRRRPFQSGDEAATHRALIQICVRKSLK